MIVNSRECLISHQKLDKDSLFRLVKVEGKPIIDVDLKLGGRGYYIKKDKEVISKLSPKRLYRAFPGISEEEVASLKEKLYELL